jgi:hypothetical protein
LHSIPEGVGVIGEKRRMKMAENDPLMLAIVKLVNPETAKTPIDVVTGSSSPCSSQP